MDRSAGRVDLVLSVAPAVEQTDIHSPQTTVHEALIYSAYLRLPGKVYQFAELGRIVSRCCTTHCCLCSTYGCTASARQHQHVHGVL